MKDFKLYSLIGEDIEIIEMLGEPDYGGRQGTVEYEDDAGQLHGTWGGLAVNPKIDTIRVI